ncbi:acyl-CoA thioesterase [Rhodococcus opacus]|uniref:acyl-CoA thioesterase n=1 Tax=Rhodococcus opacus TaxID=37919 RepID=UPI00030BA07C|nr:thioesterase family protein [Rhodococcus opacus]
MYSHRIRYHEVDQQGYLFNSRYLEIADVAMTEFFRSLGWQYDALIATGTDPSVVKSEIAFVSPCRFDDVLDAETVPTRVGTSSFRLRITLRRSGGVVATIENTYVNVDLASARSRPLPTDVAEALEREVRVETT